MGIRAGIGEQTGENAEASAINSSKAKLRHREASTEAMYRRGTKAQAKEKPVHWINPEGDEECPVTFVWRKEKRNSRSRDPGPELRP